MLNTSSGEDLTSNITSVSEFSSQDLAMFVVSKGIRFSSPDLRALVVYNQNKIFVS